MKKAKLLCEECHISRSFHILLIMAVSTLTTSVMNGQSLYDLEPGMVRYYKSCEGRLALCPCLGYATETVLKDTIIDGTKYFSVQEIAHVQLPCVAYPTPVHIDTLFYHSRNDSLFVLEGQENIYVRNFIFNDSTTMESQFNLHYLDFKNAFGVNSRPYSNFKFEFSHYMNDIKRSVYIMNGFPKTPLLDSLSLVSMLQEDPEHPRVMFPVLDYNAIYLDTGFDNFYFLAFFQMGLGYMWSPFNQLFGLVEEQGSDLDRWILMGVRYPDGTLYGESYEFNLTPNSADDDTFLPTNFRILNTYPNPFNPITNLSFSLDQGGKITISVYDIMGRKVVDIFEGFVASGIHQQQIDLSGQASGVYIIRIQSETDVQNRRITLLK